MFVYQQNIIHTTKQSSQDVLGSQANIFVTRES